VIEFRLLSQEAEVVELEIETPGAVLTVVTDLRLDGESVVLYDLHVDGPGAGTLGLAKLRTIVRAAMEAYDVEVLEVRGYRRTTGAAPGRWPGVLRFTRR
jgi:hypothetical protein